MSGSELPQEFVREIQSLKDIVQAVTSNARLAKSKNFEFKATLEEYQEQPQLLDPHLDHLATPLTAHLSESAKHLDNADDLAGTMQVCRLLQALVSTRGHKTIVRFFPNKPPDLERAVVLLRHMQTTKVTYEVDEDAQDGSWQTRCMVLLWLSSLVLIPFDIRTVHITGGSRSEPDGSGDSENSPSIVAWLVDVASQYLSDSGATRCALHPGSARSNMSTFCS